MVSLETPLFSLKNISKYFTRVVANNNISFDIHRGEVLALLGENGAGKSTIMKILYGLYQMDEGEILKDGNLIQIDSPKDAIKNGIAMIQQHFSLVSAHTVTENIILGSKRGRIDLRTASREVGEMADKYHFDLDPNALIRDLDVGVQQKVEILKTMFQEAQLLIMDEPTAVLTPQESENLMIFVRQFAAAGHSVIFITHKLKEVMSVADRIIVMRDGEVHGDLLCRETNESELSRLMIGRDLIAPHKPETVRQMDGKNGLVIRHLSSEEKEMVSLSDINFTIKPGEILGVAGVSGNGQEELCEVLIGARAHTTGQVILNHDDLTDLSLRERIAKGIGYVPVNRYRDAFVMSMSLAENMFLKSTYDSVWQRHGFINFSQLNRQTDASILEYNIKAPGADAVTGSLSGGNQQKMLLAREVRLAKSLLILNQPTRGLDLGAINNVHTTILKAREENKCILLISTELSEIFMLSDRIAVMYKGRIVGIYEPKELNTERIGLLMAGFDDHQDEEVAL